MEKIFLLTALFVSYFFRNYSYGQSPDISYDTVQIYSDTPVWQQCVFYEQVEFLIIGKPHLTTHFWNRDVILSTETGSIYHFSYLYMRNEKQWILLTRQVIKRFKEYKKILEKNSGNCRVLFRPASNSAPAQITSSKEFSIPLPDLPSASGGQ